MQVRGIELTPQIAIHNKSSEHMAEVADGSVALMITSPPYNVGLEYEDDLTSDEHLDLIRRVLLETIRKLRDGGRVCINVSDIGRDPFYDLSAHTSILASSLGLTMRGKIVWHKGNANGCAWGSFASASAPVLRDNREFVLIFSKGAWALPPGKSTISNEDFTAWTQALWTIKPESNRSHPAPFPGRVATPTNQSVFVC